MLSDKSYVIIDFSNLVYISFFAAYGYKDKVNIPKDYDKHVEYFHRCMGSYRRWNAMSEFVYALDTRPEEKYRLFPGYKGSREPLTHKDGTRFDAQIGILKSMDPGSKALKAPGFEADDVIASFVAQNFYNEVVVISTDKDIWQLLDHPNARIYDPNPRRRCFINKNHVREAFCRKDKHKVIHEHLEGFAHIKLWKSLWGDAGDAVPNVVPRKQKELIPVINASDGTLDDFFEKAEEAKLSVGCRTLLNDAKDKILLNHKLVKLDYCCDIETEVLNLPDVEEGAPWDENGNALTQAELDKIF